MPSLYPAEEKPHIFSEEAPRAPTHQSFEELLELLATAHYREVSTFTALSNVAKRATNGSDAAKLDRQESGVSSGPDAANLDRQLSQSSVPSKSEQVSAPADRLVSFEANTPELPMRLPLVSDTSNAYGEAKRLSAAHSFAVSKAWANESTSHHRHTHKNGGQGALLSRSGSDVSRSDLVTASDSMETFKGTETPTHCLTPFILSPSSQKRLAWDLAGVLMLCWDIVVIPLNAFEGITQSDFVRVMGWVTMIFWTLDMPASLLVGYTTKGEAEMRPRKILRNYLKTWFVLDCIIVVPDWVATFALAGGGGASDVGKSLRIIRVIRSLRLVRLVKLKRISQSIQDSINSEYTSIIIELSKLTFGLLVVNHFIACAWYFIGSSGDTQRNWIVGAELKGETDAFLYLTSLHWSLTQFTPSTMRVEASTEAERVFAICVLLCGMIIFSSYVSGITSSMTHLRAMVSNTSKQMWMLRRYLSQRSISKDVTSRVIRYLEFACQQHSKHIPESHVTILSLLSDQLNEELQCAVALPNISVHPFFTLIGRVSEVILKRLSSNAISHKALAAQDTMFTRGERCTNMYFPISGKLEYFHQDVDELSTLMHKNIWLCETSLWTAWLHLGELKAHTESDLISMSADKFATVLHASPSVWDIAKDYAVWFVKLINDTDRAMLTDVGTVLQPHIVLEQMLDNDPGFQTVIESAGLQSSSVLGFSQASSYKSA